MTSPDQTDPFRLFIREQFFDESTCQKIVAAMSASEEAPSALYGRSSSGSVDETMRKSQRHALQPEFVDLVRMELHESKSEIEEHFEIDLYNCEDPQFLRYRVGDFFVAHQDGNTGMLRLDQENRRISVVILLTPSDAYTGGDLVLHDYRNKVSRRPFSKKGVGTLVAFPSETTHEVTPVTSGERLSIACWYR